MIAKLKSRLGIEVWKDIPEFEGFYQVSNLGNVKSLRRVDSKDAKAMIKDIQEDLRILALL